MLGAICGCKAERSRDCENLVTSLNTVLSAIDRHVSARDGGPITNVEDMRKLASLYGQLADRIAQTKLTEPELLKQAQEYRAMVKAAGAAAAQVADAVAQENLEKAMAAQNQFTALVSKEDQVVQRINTICAHR